MKHFSIGKLAAVAACFALTLGLFAGCSSQSSSSTTAASSGTANSGASEQMLSGSQLDIYCGAGMTDPFTEIAEAFEAETGCNMNVTFANAAQIQTQISTTEQGDFFIAGASDELKPIEQYIENSVELVNHIPVLAVPKGNPANVTDLASLASCTKVLVGDPESTPIGKIAKNALTKAGLWDQLMNSGIITTTTTAPQIATALSNNEGQAGIVWKENAKEDLVDIIDSPEMNNLIKTIPCAQLTCAANEDAVAAFNDFIVSDTAWDIWAKYGYERVGK